MTGKISQRINLNVFVEEKFMFGFCITMMKIFTDKIKTPPLHCFICTHTRTHGYLWSLREPENHSYCFLTRNST